MTDLIHYKVPGWWLGDIADKLFISKQLDNIFKYRYRKVEELFGKWETVVEPYALKSV
jgi:hypothetical protein